MSKSLIDQMVDRFLSWKLPEAFSPDCYISFDKESASKIHSWPVGTNLFTADQAKEMFQHVTAGMPVYDNLIKANDITLFTYLAQVIKIVDADTIDLMVDLGFDVHKKVRCRLAGINAPEMKTEEGKLAKAFLVQELPLNSTVIMISKEYDKYGRSVADILYNNVSLSKLLLEKGFAVPYMS